MIEFINDINIQIGFFDFITDFTDYIKENINEIRGPVVSFICILIAVVLFVIILYFGGIPILAKLGYLFFKINVVVLKVVLKHIAKKLKKKLMKSKQIKNLMSSQKNKIQNNTQNNKENNSRFTIKNGLIKTKEPFKLKSSDIKQRKKLVREEMERSLFNTMDETPEEKTNYMIDKAERDSDAKPGTMKRLGRTELRDKMKKGLFEI